MKKIILTVFAWVITGAAFGLNRIATVTDQELYGPYITPGDLIIDTPTKISKGKRDVVYYFMAKEWPGIREGATIWLDGDKLGILHEIKFCNTSRSMMPWTIESARFKNIPHTRVMATFFVCNGLKDFELDGQSEQFPGLSAWPRDRKFLTGSFGFHIINNILGGHGYSVTVRDGGSIVLKGFEVQHGFSGVRINGGNDDITVESIEISNFYIHDTGDGEGQYLGATHGPPLAKLRNLRVHHGIIARTAAEAIQVQHLVGGADIHHITVYAADVRWLNEFMPGQDTGIQWSVDAGENKFHHVIVDGFGSVGLIPFGSNEQPTGGVSKVSNVLFNDGRDTGMYLHNSTSFGVHWVFDSVYFRGFNALYYTYTGRRERHYIVSRKYGSDRMTFTNIFHDGTKPKVFDNVEGLEIGSVIERKLPAPEYQNSGFHEPANRIKQWHEFYAPYFPVSIRGDEKIKVPTQWNAGDIAIQTEGGYFFYKCIKTHAAHQPGPSHNPLFIRLTWDAKGVRSDQPQWDKDSAQSFFPPDDFRLKEHSYWEKLNIGYQELAEE